MLKPKHIPYPARTYGVADNSEKWIVARSEEEARAKAVTELGVEVGTDIKLVQDDDVLDTWFSSSLFPISVYGWPGAGSDDMINKYYPLSVMETGHDILFFWYVWANYKLSIMGTL